MSGSCGEANGFWDLGFWACYQNKLLWVGLDFKTAPGAFIYLCLMQVFRRVSGFPGFRQLKQTAIDMAQ